jgi:hypothetical protein
VNSAASMKFRPGHRSTCGTRTRRLTRRTRLQAARPHPSLGTSTCEAQGGVFCGRDARIKLAMTVPEKLGRYGDEPMPRPLGVETSALESHAVAWNAGMQAHRRVYWVVESVRHTWEILRKQQSARTGSSFAERAQPAQPWTCVNNCTGAQFGEWPDNESHSLEVAKWRHHRQEPGLSLTAMPEIQGGPEPQADG